MQREDVERLATELERQDEYAPLGHMGWEAAAALRALLAERDAAFAAGQESTRERAAKECDRLAGDPRMYNEDRRRSAGQCGAAIRALPIKPRP